jgi:hypothetical protein
MSVKNGLFRFYCMPIALSSQAANANCKSLLNACWQGPTLGGNSQFSQKGPLPYHGTPLDETSKTHSNFVPTAAWCPFRLY